MLEIQAALIDRIKGITNSNSKVIFKSKSVEAYAGQINQNGIKERTSLPAALVMFRSGTFPIHNNGAKFDILVITESQSFDKETSKIQNLAACSTVAEYLSTRPGFTYDSKDYLIDLKNDKVSVGLILQNDRHTVIAVSVTVRKLQ